MAQILIADKQTTPALVQILGERLFFFHKKGYKLTVEETNIGPWPHWSYSLESESIVTRNEVTNTFFKLIAEGLAEFIFHEQAHYYSEEIIAHSYFYFPKHERQQILQYAAKHYREQAEKEAGREVYSNILHCLNEYLVQNNYVNIDGFITFRLKGWLEFLRKSVDHAVDDFLMEKEYQEFIRLLKYFVALQEPKINQIHVIMDESGEIKLLDQHYKPVERMQQGIHWEGYGISDREDQLVSMLITVAPHRVVLHKHIYTTYPKAADTLKHVFENRITLCKRCKFCHDMSRQINLKGE